MYQPTSLENRDLAPFGAGRERFYGRDEPDLNDLDSESSEDGAAGRSVRSSVSLEIYGLQREQLVHFSNQEYYRRLEELKSAHLRNMAELERMYISQERGGGEEEDEEARQSIRSCPARRLQRINSQEELDFHETSSGSDQSEVSVEVEDPGSDRVFSRNFLLIPEETTNKAFGFQSKASCRTSPGRPPRQTDSKVTVPKPFQMMLREEERRRRRVRTRSEVELENSLLRRELDELQECQKKFRASPAPAHIHLPLYERLSRRRTGGTKTNRAGPTAPTQPFQFLEREKRKREERIVSELSRTGPEDQRRAFRARPLPGSVYGVTNTAARKTPGPRA